MGDSLSRRMFLRRAAAASGSVIVGFDPQARLWILQGQAPPLGLEDLPALDGTLAYDDASRQAFSKDHGNDILRQPLAVLRPGSVQDVVSMVKYANRHDLQITMRGQGHSRSGETLVEAGIVIDSRTLRAIEVRNDESVDAGPGAFLGEVYEAVFTKDLTLPAMPLCSELSVGGVLSVGGWGGTSHRFGAAVDSVQELEVVTGEGNLVNCSPNEQSELFEMVLAGMGQCAIIVRARIGLVAAPSRVVLWDLLYDHLGEYISDQEQLVTDGRFDHLSGRASREKDGDWSFRIQVGSFHAAGKEPDLAALEDGVRFRSRSDRKRLSYRDYIRPETDRAATWPAARAKRHLGDLVMFVPGPVARDLTAEILVAMSKSTYGPASFTFPPHNLAHFHHPLFKLPAGKVAFSLWLFPRTVPAGETSAYAALTAETRRLFKRMSSLGGKGYIAHSSLPLSQTEWEEHFGPEAWRRLSDAKRRFDPNHVLTPGPGIFAPPSRG
ncbi:MAG: FAD-binding protein [Candidatus Methylomirabilales bacterium]